MIQIVDHLKEPENVLVRNLEKVKAALRKGEKVRIYHMGRIHGRLANLPGVEYLPLIKGVKEPDKVKAPKTVAPIVPTISEETKELLRVWGTPIYGKYGCRPPKWKGKRVAFIHWMPCGTKLEPIEIFHLNMLWAFDAADFFDEIHVRVSGNGTVPAHVAAALNDVLGKGCAVLDIKGVQNTDTWEWGTYNEFLAAAKPDADMYYLHFKGTSHTPGSSRNHNPVFADYGNFTGLTFWSYVMYLALFTIRPTEKKPAVCGILHQNPKWTEKIGWDIRPYHAAGSFQAYSGKALLARKGVMKKMLERASKDVKYMRYTVEGMMTFLFDEKDIERLGYTVTPNTSMYSGLPSMFPKLYEKFCKGPEYLVCGR